MPNSFLSISIALVCILSGASIVYSGYFPEQDILINDKRDLSMIEEIENQLINQYSQRSKSILITTETTDWRKSMLSTAQTMNQHASAEVNATIIDIDVILDADHPQTIENLDLEIEYTQVGEYIDVDNFLVQMNSNIEVTEVGEYIDVDNSLAHMDNNNEVTEIGEYIDVDNPLVQENYSSEVTEEIGEFIDAGNVDGVNIISDTKQSDDYPQA